MGWVLCCVDGLGLCGFREFRFFEHVDCVTIEEMSHQLISGCMTKNLHMAALDDTEEWTLMPLNMILSLVGGFKSLVIIVTVDPGAFKPVRPIKLL